MALSYPLDLPTFFRELGVVEASFYPFLGKNGNTTGEGEVVTVARGRPRWMGEIQVRLRRRDQQAQREALMHLLESDASATFMVTDFRRKGPSLDHVDFDLASASVVMDSVAANNRDIELSGLPADYPLTAGDFIAFEYGAPARSALHEVVVSATADVSGAIPQIEVTPPLRPGFIAGQAVNLIEPACKAKMVPGSYRPGRQFADNTSGFSFEWVQQIV